MKRSLLILLLLFVSITIISWGSKGHRGLATIAEKHLTSNTKAAVSALLNGESMTDASTWADEIRDDQEYRKTASWHFLNAPLGLSKAQFTEFVTNQDKDNIYTALLKAQANLKKKSLDGKQKAEALKFLIHLVGDAHQPMHVSRAEDKGGNAIQLRFNGKGTNLHSLWDSKLIDHEGLNNEQMAGQYDWANQQQISKWQAESPMQWLWESYQISSELYDDIKPGQTIDEAYYKKSIPIIRLRVAQAGIRLAGELNKLFSDQQVSATNTNAVTKSAEVKNIAPVAIQLAAAKNSIGKLVVVTGKVFSSKDIGSMVLVNLGAPYPNQQLTLALKGPAKAIATKINGKTITIEGTVINYKGKPEIIVTDPAKVSY
ncbi:MAG TPA: S1/P1 nuclease [Pedobacter sp.]|nr:S1/P1 nuclease [Pedobacter sp.]